MHKRLLTILATITLSTALLIGCGNKQEVTQATTETATVTTTEESTTEQTVEATATPEETVEPTLEATEEPSEEVATETETMETVAPEPTEEPTQEPQATYTYTDISVIMYAQQTVNVRDLPDTSGNKIGSLSTNDEIKISAKCTETGWYMFEYNGSVAFVSNKYVSENKVEIQQAPTDNGGSSSSASNSCPYTLWEVVDEGSKIWWYVTQPDPGWETNGHRQIQKGIYDTLSERNRDSVPVGYFGYSEQTEWIFMGTYAEGNVYKQTFEYRIVPQ